MKASYLAVVLCTACALLGGCTAIQRPPIYANIGEEELRTGVERCFEVGMTHRDFERVLSRLPTEPAEELWVRIPDSDAPVPVPAIDAQWGAQSGITIVQAPAAPVADSDLRAEHYCLRDWFDERDGWRLGPRPTINADWSSALLTGYFSHDGRLAMLRVGPTIGMSGHVYREGFTVPD